MKIGFVTFGAGDLFWKLAVKRIKKQASNSGAFFKISDYEPEKLFDISSKDDLSFIIRNKKGFGYWIWKPIVILDFLEKNPEVEAILYADAGCDLNFNFCSLKNWQRYLRNLESYECISFAMELLEKSWTKEELFKTFPLFRRFKNSEQLLGGLFLMKRDFAIDFCQLWLTNMRISNYDLLIGSFDSTIQDSHFVQHRHDQSFFSLMCKSNEKVLILNSLEEVYFEPDWNKGHEYPLWTSRNKSYVPKYKTGTLSQLWRLFERILKRLIDKMESLLRKLPTFTN
jgi:hypothetical protein